MTSFKSYSELLEVFPHAQYCDIEFNQLTGLWVYNKQESKTELVLLGLAFIVLTVISLTIYNLC
jgi:hypothetical protein